MLKTINKKDNNGNKQKTVVTAALPYANGQIHIGHLLEYIQTDIFVRFLKLVGEDALYICASDQHGTPIEINAKKAGLSPEKFVEKFWQEHQKDFASFLINFDNYWKTHSTENRELAEYFFKTLKDNNHIYTKKIPVIYCENCKRSLPDRFVKGKCPNCNAEDQYGDVCEKCNSALKGIDLIEPYCSICKQTPVQKESEHYFFRLGNFADKLKKWINAKDSWIQPEIKNLINDWFDKGLDDWCVSRDGPYFGFEIPDSKKETGEKKYFYVWLDAPIGYIASTKNYCDNHKRSDGKNIKWEDYWKDGQIYHIIGKDIAYFHYLFWPAMLTAVGIPLPKLTTHGFITVNGQKMSKSRGTFFTAKEFNELYPAEALRFYYASHLDRKLVDIDLNLDEFIAVNNNVLVGSLGNFCYRVLSFAEKNYGKIDEIAKVKEEKKVLDLIKKIKEDYAAQNFKEAVKKILQIADLGNAYFQNSEPWKSKEDKAAKAAVGWCVNLAKSLAIIVSPILPAFSEKVAAAFGVKGEQVSWDAFGFNWKGKLKKPDLLVEKIEIKEEQKAEETGEFPLQLKIGQIKEVKEHPNADALYLFKVDLGKEERQVVAGLKKHFTSKDLLNKKVVFCTNLKKAKIRGEMSEAMILVAEESDDKLYLLEVKKSEVGEEVRFGELKSSDKEAAFDDFLKLEMVIKKGNVVYDGNKLKTSNEEIVVNGAKEGSKIC